MPYLGNPSRNRSLEDGVRPIDGRQNGGHSREDFIGDAEGVLIGKRPGPTTDSIRHHCLIA